MKTPVTKIKWGGVSNPNKKKNKNITGLTTAAATAHTRDTHTQRKHDFSEDENAQNVLYGVDHTSRADSVHGGTKFMFKI